MAAKFLNPHRLLISLTMGFVFSFCTFCLTPSLFAETWTDKTGAFSVEAEYVGVNGSNVLLKKSDGTTISVPIAKLSDESRAQAKKLFEMSQVAKPNAATPNGSAPSNKSTYKPLARQLNFTPPTPPQLAAALPFPTNTSLQDAWEHVRDQALAGHLDVFWEALPGDIRQFIDSEKIRETLRPFLEESDISISPETIQLVNKLTEVLVTKKEFILNSQLLTAVPPEQLPLIKQGFDPAVGVIHEYADFTFSIELIKDYPVSDMVKYHLPRIGAHLYELLMLVPADARDALISQVSTEQTGDTTGTMTFPNSEGVVQTFEMVYYEDRWVPKDMVTRWLEEKDTIIEKMVENASSGMQIGNSPETTAMIAEMVRQIDTALDPLLAANTQQDFDIALGQAILPFLGMAGAFPGGAQQPIQ
ncbi:SHD1 domain-containing protein [Planctomycetaceae bacterium SH139]